MKLYKNPIKFLQEEYGVAAIEAAIILPLLFMVVFFIAQISFIFYDQSQMNIAASQAARQATVYSTSRPTNSDIKNIASAYLNGRLVTFASTPATPTVTVYSCPYTLGATSLPALSGCSAGACPTASYSGGNAMLITVVVQYPFTGLFKNTSQINPFNLTGTYTVSASEICE